MERWKPVPDWPEYEISSLGRVRSSKYGKTRVLSKDETRLAVTLWNDGVARRVPVRTLMREAGLAVTASVHSRPGRFGTEEERFWKKVEKAAEGCWLWLGATLQGYGIFALETSGGQRKRVRAHRFAYALERDLPEDTVLHHDCENPGCVNPDHLTPTTRAEHPLLHTKGDR